MFASPTREQVVRGTLGWSLTLAVLLFACARGAPGAGSPGGEPSAATPKTLTIGLISSEEPSKGGGFAFATGTGAAEHLQLMHAGLTVVDNAGVVQPRIAERLPTQQNGDWKVLPDGTMEVSWKLRRDVVWHDGTPLTAADVALGYRIRVDSALEFTSATGVVSQITGVTAPSPETVVMRWKSMYIAADEAPMSLIPPLPQHLLGALHESDKAALASSPLLYDQWVGLGPFRLREWQKNSFVTADAFDQYFLGTPHIDQVTIRYVSDVNVLVVQMTAGYLDVLPVGSMSEQSALVVREQWADQGRGTLIVDPVALVIAGWQMRDPNAPYAQDPRVRSAVAKLIDRSAISDNVMGGLSSVADVLVPTTDPAYRAAQQLGLPDLSYNIADGHRLLVAAGWSRDPSGTYRSQAGEPLSFELMAQSDTGTRVQLLLATVDMLKSQGLNVTSNLISGNVEWQPIASQAKGAYLRRQTYEAAPPAFVSGNIAAESNRWRGSNRGGYSSPTYDQLEGRFWSTLDKSERDQIAARMIKILLDDAAYLPLITNNEVSAVRNGIQGVTSVTPNFLRTTWNAHTWTMG